MQLYIIVSGNVQDVGYRYFTRMKAVQYHITGWVKNRPDGAVELLASGSEENLEQFIEDIKRGNPFSKVDNMEIKPHTGGETYHSFTIKY